MRVLFLDDSKDRHKIFKRNTIGIVVDHAYTAQEAISFLEDTSFLYDIIFLDHDLNAETEGDLNDEEEDGRFVAERLALMKRYREVPVVIHSLNPDGSRIMKNTLASNGFVDLHRIPFAWKKVSVEKGQMRLEN